MTQNVLRQSSRLIYILGLQDLKQAYRRALLGPFWITIGMAVQTFATGFVFSLIFKIQLEDYLPFLSLNIVIWSFIASTINESCGSISQSEALVKQMRIFPAVHSLRIVWKNALIGGHNALILPFVFIFFWRQPIQWFAFLSIPGLALLVVVLSTFGYALSIVCLRFRDLTPIVSSLLNVLYFVTPIMWKPELLGNDALAHFLLGINPLYHCFQVVRLPILGELPTAENWVGTLLIALTGCLIARILHRRFADRLVYWL
jgi:lipopolysaccharide transport system permease protein